MKLSLDISKSIEENAAVYFEKAKKAKKKLKGLKEALEKSKEKLEQFKKKAEHAKSIEKPEIRARKKEWYEKFRWFISSEGFLVIGGRDATSNDIIIKKHVEKDDLVFHTDIAGSGFFVIKTKGKKPGKITLEETAQATASFSRVWKLGMPSADVYYVDPEQVSKTAKSGEYIKKGAFMIYGKKSYLNPKLELAIGSKNSVVMAGPVSAVKKQCDKFVLIIQGKEKTSSLAKKIQKIIGGDLDDIIRALPPGSNIA